MAVAKNNPYERLYQRLYSKKGEKKVFKLARARDRRTRYLSSVRCIKVEDGKVLIEDTKLQERWQSYFYKLFDGERFDISQHTKQKEQHNFRPCSRITKEEVKEALRKVKLGNAVGPNSIPMEI